MLRVASFDVWGTLLDLGVMLDAIAYELHRLTGIDQDYVAATVYRVRSELRKLRREGKIPVGQMLEFSQEMLSETLKTDIEIVRRGVSRAVLTVDRRRLVLPDAAKILPKIRMMGLKVVILGNVMFWPSAYTRLLLEKTGLATYVDKQFYSDEIGFYKPFKEAFLKPIRYYNIAPEEMIHIGDSAIEDYEGALRAGCYAVHVKRDMREGFVRKSERGFLINSLTRLPKVIEVIMGGRTLA